jgi:hypothetical protein
MVEAEIHLMLLPKFILDICSVFELLVCCLKGIWVHPNTVKVYTCQVDPRFGNSGHLWSENDVIRLCLRLRSTSYCFQN